MEQGRGGGKESNTLKIQYISHSPCIHAGLREKKINPQEKKKKGKDRKVRAKEWTEIRQRSSGAEEINK